MANQNKGINFLNIIPAVLMLVAIFMVVGYIASGIYQILEFIAFGLFLITLALDIFYGRKVILGYAKMLLRMLKSNPLMGIAAIGLTVFFHPLVALFLFGKAMLLQKVDSLTKEFQTREGGGNTEYAEYEEVDTVEDTTPEKPEIFELPPLREKPKQTNRNEYEDLF
ncbi:MAG TPA: hypothetical protein ENJ53_04385 [Phaeodactylibacter sp.]|nr:hypothetical protein [Phaeodactylibacter sp.]